MSYLTQKEYKISGNDFKAFYDDAGKLVFVIDATIDDRKNNVLLVINPVGDRKWDDILSNDYGVALETIRPKKDNKYQKLDIEYSGLAVYDDLIHAFEDGEDINGLLNDLVVFRDASIRRSAQERLEIAEDKAEKTRETIEKTNATIADLQSKLKILRTTLSQQRKQIGKEPTKKSAAKILRTEAQIDATNEKLRRAKKRLNNAQRRLVVAEEDAELAREILARKPITGGSVKNNSKPKNLPAVKSENDALVVKQLVEVPEKEEPQPEEEFKPVEVVKKEDYQEEYTGTEEAETKTMAEEEIQPLFDKDPGIIDEEIAFKPISFDDDIKASNKEETVENYEKSVPEAGFAEEFSFAPPVAKKEEVQEETDFIAPIDIKPIAQVPETSEPAPVLDSIKAVDSIQNNYFDIKEDSDKNLSAEDLMRPAPIVPEQDAAQKDDIAVAPVSSDARPVSPITGKAAPATPTQRKPTTLYYVMLILLIILSVFTLWLYQKNAGDKTPDLIAPVVTQAEVVDNVQAGSAEELEESPFIPAVPTPVEEQEPVQEIVEEATVVSEDLPPVQPAVVEPAPAIIEEPVQEAVAVDVEPVVPVVEETIQETTVVQPMVEPVAPPMVEPVAPPHEKPAPVIESEEEIIASKPAYNVSQNEKMFVSGSEYDGSATYVNEDVPLCPDGTEPDFNGCCTGEVYTDLGAAGFNCCPVSGGDCFPPLF